MPLYNPRAVLSTADVIARLRQVLGTNDAGLVPLLGVSHRREISRWSRGERVMPPRIAIQAAALLQLPPEFLVACVELERCTQDNPGTPDEQSLAVVWRSVALRFCPAEWIGHVNTVGFEFRPTLSARRQVKAEQRCSICGASWVLGHRCKATQVGTENVLVDLTKATCEPTKE